MERSLHPVHFVVLLLVFAATVLLHPPVRKTMDANKFLAPPPEKIEYFTFGFRESMADSLWLRWIQDNDVCFTYQGVAQGEFNPNKSDIQNPRNKNCDNSWSFKMLDAVTRLAPRFKMPYEFGAITLTVATEDYEGAKVIFDRGVEQFPDDWEILYRAAYHYMMDRGDLAKAAELLTRAAKDPATPYWLSLLAARLYSKVGQLQLGIATLTAYKESIKDNPRMMKQYEDRIAALRKKMSEQSQEK